MMARTESPNAPATGSTTIADLVAQRIVGAAERDAAERRVLRAGHVGASDD